LTHRGGQMAVTLADVTITRKKKNPRDIYESVATKTLTSEEFEKQGITSYEEALRKIAGIQVRDGDVIYRGNSLVFYVDNMVWESVTSTSKSSSIPLSTYKQRQVYTQQYGNGFATSHGRSAIGITSSRAATFSRLSEFEASYPFNIMERIDFLQPGMALIISQAAGNAGALVFHTKSGNFSDWERPPYLQLKDPLGYQEPKDFYNPKYMPDSEPVFGSTIYWNPCVLVHENTELEITVPTPNTQISVNIEGFDAYSTTIHQSIQK
ncbi:MAG: Plug domain-containing protein, partial [Muribaculaceae bacterium]|nr:Plug domain-containing protein [Muribaculaceae bacterium]